MAKEKIIKIGKKTYKYKTIPSLAKQLKKSKSQTRAIVKINKLIPKLKSRQIKFKGKKIKFKTPKELGKKLKITDVQALKLLDDYRTNQTKKYIEVDGNIAKYDLRNKPLILQEFNIKKTTTKQFIGAKQIKNILTSSSLPTDKQLNLYIVATLGIVWSTDVETRTHSFNISTTSKDLEDDVYNTILNDYFGGVEPTELNIDEIKIYNKQGGQRFNLDNMVLREEKPLNIGSLFNNVIANEGSSNCVKNYISKIWGTKRISKKVKALFDDLHTTEDLRNFCEQRDIKMIAYDIAGTVISSNFPSKKNTNFKNLVFVAYNNHMYPIENQVLRKTNIDIQELKQCEDVPHAFKNKLKNGILPTNMKLHADKLVGFCVGNVHYFHNADYEGAKKILDSFGLTDHLTPYTTLKNVLSIIEKIYLKEGINSFMPQANRYIKGGFLYKSEEDYEGLEIETIDKNKSYSHSLKELPFLIKTDIRIDKRYNLTDFKNIIDHHLYLCKVKKSSNLLPKNGVYTGFHLKYCYKRQLQFTIVDAMETTRVDNNLKSMIDDLYRKVPEHVFKECMNIYMGKFATTMEMRQDLYVNKLANNDETEASDGVVIPFNDNYNFICENVQSFSIYNRKPIHIQILDNARRTNHEMMEKLKLKSADIIQVKTDSISFIKTKKTDRILKKLINKSINGWKREKYSPLGCPCVKNNCLEGFGFDLIDNENSLTQAYAGAGKTHLIINEIIPAITNSYIVITPSHASATEYYQNNINCKVIQYFTMLRKIPSEQTIIIDEIGMVDKLGWDLIYKLILLGKSIHAFGDFKQLLPPMNRTEMSSQLWVDLAFKHQKTMTTNYRNTFTTKYYDTLINGTKKYIMNEVTKYSQPITDAELIIVYRNKTRHKYNKIMCDLLDIPYNEHDNEILINIDNLKVGTKIICKDNDLRKQKIYNKYSFTIKQITKDKVILDNNITIKKEQLEHFDFAYARTIYSIQGASIKSYHYAQEDLYFITNREAYTTISRIKNI